MSLNLRYLSLARSTLIIVLSVGAEVNITVVFCAETSCVKLKSISNTETVLFCFTKISSSWTISSSGKDRVDPSPVNVVGVTLLLLTIYLSIMKCMSLNSNFRSSILFLSCADVPGLQYQLGTAVM